jgi:hypothetical protein
MSICRVRPIDYTLGPLSRKIASEQDECERLKDHIANFVASKEAFFNDPTLVYCQPDDKTREEYIQDLWNSKIAILDEQMFKQIKRLEDAETAFEDERLFLSQHIFVRSIDFVKIAQIAQNYVTVKDKARAEAHAKPTSFIEGFYSIENVEGAFEFTLQRVAHISNVVHIGNVVIFDKSDVPKNGVGFSFIKKVCEFFS